MHFTGSGLLYWQRGKGKVMDVLVKKQPIFSAMSERAVKFFEDNFNAPGGVLIVPDEELPNFLGELPKDWVIGDQSQVN